jgi:hypothetical protein
MESTTYTNYKYQSVYTNHPFTNLVKDSTLTIITYLQKILQPIVATPTDWFGEVSNLHKQGPTCRHTPTCQ